jgi:hypothetical protein
MRIAIHCLSCRALSCEVQSSCCLRDVCNQNLVTNRTDSERIPNGCISMWYDTDMIQLCRAFSFLLMAKLALQQQQPCTSGHPEFPLSMWIKLTLAKKQMCYELSQWQRLSLSIQRSCWDCDISFKDCGPQALRNGLWNTCNSLCSQYRTLGPMDWTKTTAGAWGSWLFLYVLVVF